MISPASPEAVDGFGRIFYEVEEDLNQLILVAEHRRQRRIIFFADGDRRAAFRRR